MFKTQVESYEHFDVIYKIQNMNSFFFFQITLIYIFLTSKIERVLGKKNRLRQTSFQWPLLLTNH